MSHSATGTKGMALMVIHAAFAATSLTFAAIVFIITRSPQFAPGGEPEGGRMGLAVAAVLGLGALAGWAYLQIPRLPKGWEFPASGIPQATGPEAVGASAYMGGMLKHWVVGCALIESFSASGILLAVMRHPPLIAYAQFGLAFLLFLTLMPRLMTVIGMEKALIEAGRP